MGSKRKDVPFRWDHWGNKLLAGVAGSCHLPGTVQLLPESLQGLGAGWAGWEPGWVEQMPGLDGKGELWSRGCGLGGWGIYLGDLD